MEDVLLSWRNVWRNPRRSVLTILAVFFSTSLLVFMLSFQFGTYDDMISSTVKLSTGHFQIQADGYLEKPGIRKAVDNVDLLLAEIRETEGVESAGARGEAFVLAAGPQRSRGLLVTGADPGQEVQLSSLPGQIKKGEYLVGETTGGAVIGSLAAERLQISVGDECTMLGQGRDGSIAATVVTIVGIYTTGIDEFDRSTMQITLNDFDSLFSMQGGANRIVANVFMLGETKGIVEKLRANPLFHKLQVVGWDELSPGLKQSIELDLIGGIIMYVILVLVVAFSILNTFFMAIFERTKEFGVLMSIGTKPGRLVKIMMMESLAMTAIGICLGVLVGVLVTYYFSCYGIGLGESGDILAQYGFNDRLYPKLSLVSVMTGPIIIGVVTFITAVIPVMKIPCMKPVEALRAC